MLQSSSRALASESVTEDLAGRAARIHDDSASRRFILGPSIGGVMIDYFSWRWSFFLLAPIGFGGALLAFGESQAASTCGRRRTGCPSILGAALLFAITTNAGISLRSAHSADRQWLDEDAFGGIFSR